MTLRNTGRLTKKEMTTHVIKEAKALGATLAGTAGAAPLRNSPSHRAYKKGQWAATAKSVLVLALAHETSEPELDWWDFKEGGNPGNRRLISVVNNLTQWLNEECHITAHSLPYHVEKGGIFLKDAAALAGLGVIGRNDR